MSNIQIQSDLPTASRHATAIAAGLGSTSGSVSEDSQTTVAGNDNAKAGIANLETIQGQLDGTIGDMIANIHSLANEFEAIDQDLKHSLQYLP